jgi:hypothetical protein
MKIMLDIGFEKKSVNGGLSRIYLKRAGFDLNLDFVHQVVVGAA